MKNQLNNSRKQIDGIDRSIVILLKKRMKIVKKIGQLKKKNSLSAFDRSRFLRVMKSKKGFMKKIWQIIHQEALKIEKSL